MKCKCSKSPRLGRLSLDTKTNKLKTMKSKQILIFVVIYAIWRYWQQMQATPALSGSGAPSATTSTAESTLRRDMDDLYALVNERIAKKVDQLQTATKAAANTLTTKLSSPSFIRVLADESQVGSPRALYYWDGLTLEEIIKA